jgi:hypothetical protein
VTPAEAEELHALVIQAFDLRESPYFRDAVDAIVLWHERRPLRRHELSLEERASVTRFRRLLAETNGRAA